jgi:hypothetical protein
MNNLNILIKKININNVVCVLLCYLCAFLAGMACEKALQYSLMSEITEEIILLQQKLRFVELIYTLLFITSAIGIFVNRKTYTAVIFILVSLTVIMINSSNFISVR